MKRSEVPLSDTTEKSTSAIEPAATATKKRTATTASRMLRLYLREMGATPLLDDQREVTLATQLEDARLAISKLAQALPAGCRQFVLTGDAAGPRLGAAWPLRRLEQFLRRLTSHAAQHPDTVVADALREIRIHKAALDAARDNLVVANLRLVVHIAKRYANRGLPFMDLIQEGNVGLLRAVEKFEHDRGCKFSTYAFWWIKQSVERGITEKSRTIRLPVHMKETVRRVRFAERDLCQGLARQATPLEIAAQLGIPVATVDHALTVAREPSPLERGAEDRDGYDLAQFVPDENSPSPFHFVAQSQIKQRVESVLRELTSREETILRMRFGIGHEPTQTLEQIGERLRLSRERVRQIEWRALAKIKASPRCRDLTELLGVGKQLGPHARSTRTAHQAGAGQ